MKIGPRARVALSHVARGHTLRSPSLIAAWSRLVAAGRAGAAVRVWKAAHRPAPSRRPGRPARPTRPRGPRAGPPGKGAGGGGDEAIDFGAIDIPFPPLTVGTATDRDEDDEDHEDDENGEYDDVEIETSGDYFDTD